MGVALNLKPKTVFIIAIIFAIIFAIIIIITCYPSGSIEAETQKKEAETSNNNQ